MPPIVKKADGIVSVRAAVYHGINDIRIEAIPKPSPDTGEALLLVKAAGICGTDLRIFDQGHHRIPGGTLRVLGHELIGEILEVGEGVNLSIGSRVAVAPNIGCGFCSQCISGWTNLCPNYEAFGISLDGGFAEFMLLTANAIRQGNVVEIPNQMADEDAALVEPLSCCINGQEAISLGREDVVLIMGAGPIGLMHLALARVNGTQQVIVCEPIDWRLKKAGSHGADVLINPMKEDLKDAILDVTSNEGVSAVIIATSSPEAQANALSLVRPRGRINFFGGLPSEVSEVVLNTNLIHYKQLLVTGTTGSNNRHFYEAANLISTGRLILRHLISDCLPLGKIIDGINRSKSGQDLRILIRPEL